ncbi:Uu.00g114170.m01.CDS01 [Anthostomella pinea]|uniref:Uu.00g114170.m01.CDS01 n=1 Tax=Anthostomella pinea TaxID=933095 RepID=A0AAI8VFM9_9PEZI|nr:Uu.00g114170.m01.CDS01 [Anthostomella pinea]
MAGTSPSRRSSRARTTQSQSNHSSTASSASGRVERSTRAFAKTGSPQKSTGSASLSSEPPEDSTTTTTTNDDGILRRRSTRARDDDREKQPRSELVAMPPAGNEVQEDDESVRCICGHDEYPGPPPFDEDSKHGVTDAIDHERIFAIEITDEMAGFFVQCEICNTWQHGACVGFTTEESNPDDLEYFCEQCRKDLHRTYTASNGQKYSIFLPIHRPSRAASRATSTAKDGAPSPDDSVGKSSRASAAAQMAKRRSTMNSRDAAYDEEEQLRRAIEASKEDAGTEEPESAPRRPKRGRDGSEEYAIDPHVLAQMPNIVDRKLDDIKRQRTHSKSPSPEGEKTHSADLDESEDESGTRNGSKRSRNAVRNQREKAERDERREEQERKRAEAASKRKGRAERRRVEDDDPSEEMPLAARAAVNRTTEPAQAPEPPPPSSQPPPDTPPATQPTTSTNKKKPAAQSKKKGRNQYTKDRDNHDHEDSPARSISRDVHRNGDENGTSHAKSSGHDNTTKQSKSKGGMNSRVTMSDMKRRANGILEYISRTQVELASEPLAESAPDLAQGSTHDGSGSGGAFSQTKVNGNGSTTTKKVAKDISVSNEITSNGIVLPKDFKELSCVEMMDILARDVLKWQNEFFH